VPKPSRSLAVVVLAAGEGKRMKSALPKVLQPLCGRASLWHALQAARKVRPDRIAIVVSYDKAEVEAAVREWGIKPAPVFVDQAKPLGTGHAVSKAEEAVGRASDVLVMAGDEPLHTGDTLRAVLRLHRGKKAAATLLTTEVDDATGYGRIIRSGDEFIRIAEEKDATAAERRIGEIATMVYAFRREDLYRALPLVGTDNRQHEYYLPDVLGILKDKGEEVAAMATGLGTVPGINSRSELADATAVMRARINQKHLGDGVTLIDPAQTYIDIGVKIGNDCTIHPQTSLEGDTRLGHGCEVGPATRLVDTRVGDGASVTFSVVRGAKLGRDVSVGPYTHLRPGTVMEDGSRAGAFVEIKGSRIGKGSKVPHLAYVGDATLGQDVNIGAGTVTVNYDGYEKHRTAIGDGVRVGSDTMLVAPVKIGKGAVTGAGSTITKDVPPGALAVERGEQRQVKGYRKRKDAEKGAGKTAKGAGKKRS